MKITLTAKELLSLHGLVGILSASEIVDAQSFKNKKSNVSLIGTRDGGVIIEVNQELFYHVATAFVGKIVLAVPVLKMFGGMFKSLGDDLSFIRQKYTPSFNMAYSHKNVKGVEVFNVDIIDNEIKSITSYPEYYDEADCKTIGKTLVDIQDKIEKELKTVDASAVIEIKNLEATKAELAKRNGEVSEILEILRNFEK